jgi:7,8-dihydro-6-hydroxymethylpterin-pyrophosphokinase
MGRAPGTTNAPRPIDIDILFCGEQIIKTPELTIPHPRLSERAFVLVPLAEIAPELVHPVSHKTVKELLLALPDTSGVVKWEKRES